MILPKQVWGWASHEIFWALVSLLTHYVGVIISPAMSTPEGWNKGNELSEHSYKVDVGGIKMAPQRCPPPNPQNLWLCYFTMGTL